MNNLEFLKQQESRYKEINRELSGVLKATSFSTESEFIGLHPLTSFFQLIMDKLGSSTLHPSSDIKPIGYVLSKRVYSSNPTRVMNKKTQVPEGLNVSMYQYIRLLKTSSELYLPNLLEDIKDVKEWVLVALTQLENGEINLKHLSNDSVEEIRDKEYKESLKEAFSSSIGSYKRYLDVYPDHKEWSLLINEHNFLVKQIIEGLDPSLVHEEVSSIVDPLNRLLGYVKEDTGLKKDKATFRKLSVKLYNLDYKVEMYSQHIYNLMEVNTSVYDGINVLLGE